MPLTKASAVVKEQKKLGGAPITEADLEGLE
jgi:hypothetical protein